MNESVTSGVEAARAAAQAELDKVRRRLEEDTKLAAELTTLVELLTTWSGGKT